MDIEYIRNLIEVLKETDITDFELEQEGKRLHLKREKNIHTHPETQYVTMPTMMQPMAAQHPAAAPAPAAPAAPSPESEAQHRLITVTSPLVGTFYRSSSPDSQAFVEVGTRVKKGQVLCIVEAMKLMNEIESECDGVVARIIVENAHTVEYGEPLFQIDPQ